ncbi:MAG: universal stress protein [Rhodopila sp.]|jgi:nucleotide-binding universal stress UspA family protein|nr:universal stress protein [Rhodopila sp.]
MKGLRDITVVLEESARSEIRLTIAVALAQQHDAHLTGLSALDLLMPTKPFVPRRGNPEVDTQPASQLQNWGVVPPVGYREMDMQVAEKAEQIEAAFRERLRSSGLQGTWRMATDDMSESVVCQARQADLVILGQVNPRHPPPLGRQLIEAILMTSGRPILVIPYVGRIETVGTKILVGWNNTREAARAVNDAIPLLAQATSVTILEVDSMGRKPATSDRDATGADIARHLDRHGISAEAHTVASGISVPDALLNYAADVSADLLVVGGYGHSRLRELILGGVTRELLQHMTLPVLMSH